MHFLGLNNLAQSTPLYTIREDLAEALAERNVLRQTTTIQISSDKNVLSIKFVTKEIMGTFCLEPLLERGYNIPGNSR